MYLSDRCASFLQSMARSWGHWQVQTDARRYSASGCKGAASHFARCVASLELSITCSVYRLESVKLCGY